MLQTTRSARSPFFIIGCGRSGTTLLRAMLNHHPELAIPVESLFIVDYLRAAPTVSMPTLAKLLVNDYEFREWGVPLETADLAGCTTAREMIDRIHELFLAHQGKKIWGQKTPRFIRHGRLLKTHYPHARFIHVLRDPRAVVNSLIRSNLHRSNAYFAARRWLIDVRAGMALKEVYPEDVFELRYEDLVASPEESLCEVCRFLAVPYSDSMLAYYQAGAEEYSSFFSQVHARLNELPRHDRIDGWRMTLSDRDQALVEALCAETMSAFGYSPDGTPEPIDRLYVAWLKLERQRALVAQILHRLLRRFRPLFSFVWRKVRLGLLWRDLREVNY